MLYTSDFKYLIENSVTDSLICSIVPKIPEGIHVDYYLKDFYPPWQLNVALERREISFKEYLKKYEEHIKSKNLDLSDVYELLETTSKVLKKDLIIVSNSTLQDSTREVLIRLLEEASEKSIQNLC